MKSNTLKLNERTTKNIFTRNYNNLSELPEKPMANATMMCQWGIGPGLLGSLKDHVKRVLHGSFAKYRPEISTQKDILEKFSYKDMSN